MLIAGVATAIFLACWGQLNWRVNRFDESLRQLECSNAAICAHFNIIVKSQASRKPGDAVAADRPNPVSNHP
jgi:hypothetical protein